MAVKVSGFGSTLAPDPSPKLGEGDQYVLRRLKALARLKNQRYQTLLKEFVTERLYEQEKRAGFPESHGTRSAL